MKINKRITIAGALLRKFQYATSGYMAADIKFLIWRVSADANVVVVAGDNSAVTAKLYAGDCVISLAVNSQCVGDVNVGQESIVANP